MAELDLARLLAGMEPRLNDEAVVFVQMPQGISPTFGWHDDALIGAFREAEGWTVILRDGAEGSLPVLFRAAWITLLVHSDMAAVGLTAAFAEALGAQGISCNVVAAGHHDHIFVAHDDGARALAALKSLQIAHA